MNSLKTLFFPATVIHSIRQYPVFLLFQKINIIAPTEQQRGAAARESTDTFIKSGFCQVDTPCPLGDNLSRFHHLVEDIRNRRDDYAAQLSSLTLAGMSTPANRGEESERSIINEFLTPKDLKAEEETQNLEAKLWQARLVLAIGEILDREEEEIARNLAMVEDETSGLFNSLRGDEDEFDDTPFGELSQLTKGFSAAHGGNMRKRLNSWKILYGESSCQDADLFITSSPDVADILTESFEKLASAPLVQLHGLELPGLIGWSGEEAVEAVTSFAEISQELREQFEILAKGLQTDANQQKRLDEFCSKWNTQLEARFPGAQWGRLPVTIRVFPGCTVNTLLGFNDETGSGNGVLLLLG